VRYYYWEKNLGTHWELWGGDPLGTWWEHIEKKQKFQNTPKN